MRKLTAIALICMVLLLVPLSSFAGSGKYQNTQKATDVLEEQEIIYTYLGVGSDGEDGVLIQFSEDDFDFDMRVYFHEDNESVHLLVWDLITFQKEDFAAVVNVCNHLNAEYRFITFHAEKSDNSVTATFDLVVRPNDDIGDIVFEAMGWMEYILLEGYPYLSAFHRE
jgi:hypothetical protein